MKQDKIDILTKTRTSKLLSHDFFLAMFMTQKNSVSLLALTSSKLSIQKRATCDRSTSADSQDDWKLKRKLSLAI